MKPCLGQGRKRYHAGGYMTGSFLIVIWIAGMLGGFVAICYFSILSYGYLLGLSNLLSGTFLVIYGVPILGGGLFAIGVVMGWFLWRRVSALSNELEKIRKEPLTAPNHQANLRLC